MNPRITGTGVALITPFDHHQKVDYPALEKILNFLVNGGIEYLVVQGTTGESVTLDKEEKKQILAFVVEKISGKLPIVLGIGGNNTREVLKSMEQFDFRGLDAILSVSPYYNKPTQQGIYLHYQAVAKESPLPLILYNVPGRTGSNMTADTTLRIAREFSNIVAIKEASGNFPQIMEIIKNKPAHFEVISGDDILTLPMISMGAIGVISVAAQAAPATFSEMVRLALAGDFRTAAARHYELQDLMNALFADGSPGGIKAALHCLGLCEQELRLPLAPVSDPVYQKIKSLMASL